MDFTTHNLFAAAAGYLNTAAWSLNVVTATSTGGTQTPGPCNIYFRRSIMAFTYTSAELSAAFGKNSATITGLRFFVVGQPLYQPLGSYAIGMKLVSTDAVTNPGSTGYTIVKTASGESFTSNTNKVFDPLTTSFTWTSGNNLAIAFAWAQSPTTWNASGQCYVNSSGSLFYTWTDNAGTYVINTDSITTTAGGSRPVMQLYG